MFIVAMISAVVCAPLALSVQYLIMNVLSKRECEREGGKVGEPSCSIKKVEEHSTSRCGSGICGTDRELWGIVAGRLGQLLKGIVIPLHCSFKAGREPREGISR
jgi:uncharacterized low-complexity protein